jgi:hypothetical protein
MPRLKRKESVRNQLLRLGWFISGALSGAVLMIVLFVRYKLEIDATLPVIDLAQLAATMFLALYIPLALERLRDQQQYARNLLINHVLDLVAGVRAVNEVLRECASRAETHDRDRMQVRTRFLTSNAKMGRLEKRIGEACSDCTEPLRAFRAAYDKYYDAVTGGSLYGQGMVTWDFWRNQEFAFIHFENSATDLSRFLSDS